jgi:hypothetical protein
MEIRQDFIKTFKFLAAAGLGPGDSGILQVEVELDSSSRLASSTPKRCVRNS